MSQTKNIVVVGGGYAGIHAIKKLYKQFKRDTSVIITLIDKNPYHTLMTELHEVAGSRVHQDSVQISFQRIFGGTNVKVVTDFVTNVDFEAKSVQCSTASYPYDYLLLTAGGAPEFFGIEGVQEHSFTLWSLEDSMRIRDHVEACFRNASCEADAAIRRRMLTFAVAGAGFTGIELAGELLERRTVLCRRYHIDESEVRVMVVEAMGKILPILSDKLRAKTEKRLQKMGAEVLLNAPITKAEEGSFTIGGTNKVEADTLIWTCGIHGGELSARLPLTKGQEARGLCSFASPEGIHGLCGCRFDEDEQYVVGRRGRILVNDHMQSVDFPEVFLAGDLMWFVEKEKVLPQIVETAIQTGETAAANIIADIKGSEKHLFKSNYHGFMVSIGSKYGVSNAGGMELSGIPAMVLKHLINLHYLFGVAGINAVWAYLQHEFFTIRDGRSISRSHLSAKIPAYWAVPLRIFLGAKWLYEGAKKAFVEGWFNPDKIRIPGVKFAPAAQATAEAVSAASGAGYAAAATPTPAVTEALSAASGAAYAAATATPQAVEALTAASGAAAYVTPSPAAVTEALSAASGAAEAVSAASGATDAAAPAAAYWPEALVKKDWLIYQIYEWFAQTFLGIHPVVAYLAQITVVSAEIAIGLALIGGLFTFAASAASIGLGLMFIMSAMGGHEILWYIAAAIVMMGGAGRGFGLDHWVMPWLHRKWNQFPLVQRTHLYLGEPTHPKKKQPKA